MYIKTNSLFVIVLSITFGFLPATTCAQNGTEYDTPFDSYSRATFYTFVYEPSQYSHYKGPDVSRWNLPYEDSFPELDRTRWGIYSISKTQRVYVDEVWGPIAAHIQLIDIKNNEIIHEFIYKHQIDGAILFNGDGIVYQYSRPEEFCAGGQTKKFVLKNNKLEEVPQPFTYLENTETKLLSDVTLYFATSTASNKVATLKKGTAVRVLSVENRAWYLIKSPLGLTGWIDNGAHNVSITQCN